MFRKNVAGQFLYFCLVKAADGTALTGATVTGKRSIDGAAQGSVTGTITEDALGQYHLALSQADINGNDIGYLFTATGAIPVSIHVVTTAADPTDAVAFGLSRIDAAISSRSTYAGGDTSGTTTLLGRIPGTVQPQTGDAYARLGAPAGASVSADVAAVKSDSGGLRTDYTTARAGYLDVLNGIVAAIWAAATRTLTAFGFTTGLTAQQVANAVWDEPTASHGTAATTGKALTSASAAGDPWAVALPGSYAAGTAGRIVGGTPNTYTQQGAGDTPFIGR